MTSFLKDEDDPQFEDDVDDSKGAGGRRELKLESDDVDFKRELTVGRHVLSGGHGLLLISCCCSLERDRVRFPPNGGDDG
jgi:hypothetical protein